MQVMDPMSWEVEDPQLVIEFSSKSTLIPKIKISPNGEYLGVLIEPKYNSKENVFHNRIFDKHLALISSSNSLEVDKKNTLDLKTIIYLMKAILIFSFLRMLKNLINTECLLTINMRFRFPKRKIKTRKYKNSVMMTKA